MTDESPTLFLADDDPNFQMLATDMLCVHGPFTLVGLAPNGQDAVELALQFRPCVVLMDVQMPKLDGFQATRMIRAQAPEIPVIITSFLSGRQFEEMALQAGAVAYLPKASLSVAAVLSAVPCLAKFIEE